VRVGPHGIDRSPLRDLGNPPQRSAGFSPRIASQVETANLAYPRSMLGIETDAERVGAYSPVVLTRILKRTASEGASGALHVVSGPSVKTIHLERGSVRFAASNIRRDRLGECMLAHEFISKDDYLRASEMMREEHCRFGEALLQLGRLTEKELQRELAIQVQRIVLSLFKIPGGTYSYEESPAAVSTALPFGLSVPPLLLKGLRAIDDGKLILSAIPPSDAWVRPVTPSAYPLKVDKLSATERMVLDLAEEGASIGDIIRRCPLGRSLAFRSVFALLALGFLEPIPSEGPAGAEEEGEGEEEEPFRERIIGQHERLADMDERGLLELSEDSTVEAIPIAYEAAKAEWAAIRDATRDESLLEKIDAIEFRLAAAYAQLRVESEQESQRKEETTQSETGPEDFARRERMSQLERDARLHLQVRDWNGSLPLLHELVALEPDRADFQAMMGQAMQHLPAMRRNAEQHFVEAVKLAPDDAEIRLELARYYISRHNRSRALGELQTVLGLDPGNKEAHRLKSSLREPTRMQRLFRRVFR
jgi:tetratricopeptide (TPR) repeat protein